MAYGAYLLLDNGNPFYTPDSTPLRLASKHSVRSTITNANARASITINHNVSTPFVPFVVARSDGNQPVAFSMGLPSGGNQVVINGFSYSGNNTSNFTMEVYFFSMSPRSAASGYGMAIYNQSGQLILTHEDKVLTDMETVGSRGTPSAGIGANAERTGKWGVVPAFAGWYLFRVDSGGPGVIIVPISAGFGATYNGIKTNMYPQILASNPSNQGAGSGSTGTPMTILNLAPYD